MNAEDGRLVRHSTELTVKNGRERKRTSTMEHIGRSRDDEAESKRKRTDEHL